MSLRVHDFQAAKEQEWRVHSTTIAAGDKPRSPHERNGPVMRAISFISHNQAANQLQRLDVRRLHTLRAFLRFEADFLILLQTFEALGANLREMRE